MRKERAMAKTSRQTLKAVLSRAKSSRFLLIPSLLLAAVSAASALYIPILVGDGIDLIIGSGMVDFKALVPILLRAAAVAAAAAPAQYLMNRLNNKIAYNTVRELRCEAFGRLHRLPMNYFDTNPTGDILSRLTTDADQLADGLIMSLTQLFTGVFTIIGTLALMLSLDPWIALAVIILTPLSLFTARFISSKTYSMFGIQSQVRGKQTSFIEERINNIKLTKAYSDLDDTEARFDKINDRLEKCSVKAIFFSSLTNPTTRFVNNLVYAVVALFGTLAVIGGGLTVGGLSCLLSYASQYAKPFNEISGVIAEMQNSLACGARLIELTEEPEENPDPEDAVELENVRGNVEFRDVSFSYVKGKPLLHDINISVPEGRTAAITGPTGCGKTTLINLLMRFYDVDGGCIFIDGTDITKITRESLRRNFAMVLQDTWLKSGTVRENIAFGRPDATDEEILSAARSAHALGFIRRLPDGLNTVIGESGGTLSQGQRQLLCIARAMLCLPPMLILDEATSSIDMLTEEKIRLGFDAMMKGRTSFVVAHRLSTVRNADLRLEFHDGTVTQRQGRGA